MFCKDVSNPSILSHNKFLAAIGLVLFPPFSFWIFIISFSIITLFLSLQPRLYSLDPYYDVIVGLGTFIYHAKAHQQNKIEGREWGTSESVDEEMASYKLKEEQYQLSLKEERIPFPGRSEKDLKEKMSSVTMWLENVTASPDFPSENEIENLNRKWRHTDSESHQWRDRKRGRVFHHKRHGDSESVESFEEFLVYSENVVNDTIHRSCPCWSFWIIYSLFFLFCFLKDFFVFFFWLICQWMSMKKKSIWMTIHFLWQRYLHSLSLFFFFLHQNSFWISGKIGEVDGVTSDIRRESLPKTSDRSFSLLSWQHLLWCAHNWVRRKYLNLGCFVLKGFLFQWNLFSDYHFLCRMSNNRI